MECLITMLLGCIIGFGASSSIKRFVRHCKSLIKSKDTIILRNKRRNSLDYEKKEECELIIYDTNGEPRHQIIPKNAQSVSVGSDELNDNIVIDHMSISKKHMLIARDKEGLFIRDNGSVHGIRYSTYGERIARYTDVEVVNGLTVFVGKVRVEFVLHKNDIGLNRMADKEIIADAVKSDNTDTRIYTRNVFGNKRNIF